MSNLPAAREKQSDEVAVMTEAITQREESQVQAAMAIAKRFPRNQAQALDRILIACQRPALAEKALFSYARGGTEISDGSIRLAETIVQQWGNVDFGIRELEQRMGESTVEAYAWDLETNTRQAKVFQVKHQRFTKKGSYYLTDPRDIYELIANQGARRLRACIFGIIPPDIKDAAVEQCEATLKAKVDTSPEALKKMVGVFAELGVSQQQIEARIQRNLESITAAQVISLRKIYNSLKDNMSKPQDWFDVEAAPEPQGGDLKAKLRGRPKKEPEAPPPFTEASQEGDGELKPPAWAYLPKVKFLLECKGADNITLIFRDYEVDSLEALTQEQAMDAIAWLEGLPDA